MYSEIAIIQGKSIYTCHYQGGFPLNFVFAIPIAIAVYNCMFT